MTQSSVENILQALNLQRVRYLVVGGLAVVAHGYLRFTADVDLVLGIELENLRAAVSALKSLDYRPRVPVSIEDFIDPANRRRWADEKNMMVFSLFSPRHPATNVDLFLEPPFDFASAYTRAVSVEVALGLAATFCSRDDLIMLKTKAGRPLDLEDIAQLRARETK